MQTQTPAQTGKQTHSYTKTLPAIYASKKGNFLLFAVVMVFQIVELMFG